MCFRSCHVDENVKLWNIEGYWWGREIWNICGMTFDVQRAAQAHSPETETNGRESWVSAVGLPPGEPRLEHRVSRLRWRYLANCMFPKWCVLAHLCVFKERRKENQCLCYFNPNDPLFLIFTVSVLHVIYVFSMTFFFLKRVLFISDTKRTLFLVEDTCKI